MPRPPRIVEADAIYHVLNRANARAQIFSGEGDYRAFEEVLIEAKEKHPMRILAYCLMPNHWHFVLHPEGSEDLSSFMRWLTLTHTQRWLTSKRMIGYGHVYQGRYKSFPVQKDKHFLRVCKYVESNASRAGLSKKAEEWRWGSAWVRIFGSPDQKQLLSEWPIPMSEGYLSYLNQEEDEGMLKSMRNSVNRGAPLGSERWVERMAEKLTLESALRPRGRPRKGT